MNMTVVRLYKDVNGRRKYLSKQYTTTGKGKNRRPRVHLTFNKRMAMVFKTTEELVQFNYYFPDMDLMLEREQVDHTFEDEFGVDILKDAKAEMIDLRIKQDQIEHRIAEVDAKLNALKDVNLDELETLARIEVEEVIENLNKEKAVYENQLSELMEDDYEDINN